MKTFLDMSIIKVGKEVLLHNQLGQVGCGLHLQGHLGGPEYVQCMTGGCCGIATLATQGTCRTISCISVHDHLCTSIVLIVFWGFI